VSQSWHSDPWHRVRVGIGSIGRLPGICLGRWTPTILQAASAPEQRQRTIKRKSLMTNVDSDQTRVGLLLSGGLDSSILLAWLAGRYRVQPIHIATDCEWASAERNATREFVGALNDSHIEPLVELQMSLADLYGAHWSLTGRDVPDASSPDEEVYLWGRNPLLLVKAAVWCQMHGIEQLAIGTLNGNPFADATPAFFEQFTTMLNLATGKPLELWAPFSELGKEEVLRLGRHLPLERTFSCLSPREGLHCGECNKCYERASSFATLNSRDPTHYAKPLQLMKETCE